MFTSTTTLSLSSFVSSIPTDIVILGTSAVVLILLALYAGSSKVIVVSLAALIALQTFSLIPSAAFLSSFVYEKSGASTDIVVFFALLVVLTFLLRTMLDDEFQITTPFQAVLAGLGGTIILLLAWLQVPPLETLWNFSGTVRLFVSEAYYLWWIVGALLLLMFSRT